ncbi:unnamed protein product [Triticum turgidum subsp. durum]|uniref:Secreted protein n=1 Tax=Triticum turgidum subsp. durum TaxID=4567 RepID=A0A9R0VYG1_TRITD|nr:unnamed protein product [Triticum turgidum subsp. durum]
MACLLLCRAAACLGPVTSSSCASLAFLHHFASAVRPQAILASRSSSAKDAKTFSWMRQVPCCPTVSPRTRSAMTGVFEGCQVPFCQTPERLPHRNVKYMDTPSSSPNVGMTTLAPKTLDARTSPDRNAKYHYPSSRISPSTTPDAKYNDDQ